MYDNWNYGLKMVFSLLVISVLMLASAAEKVANADDGKELAKAPTNQHHAIAKRAWNQLQGSWGKRSVDEDLKDDSIEELQRKIMKYYSEQLENKVDDNDFEPEDYEGPVDKRAWKSMSNAWGKRDWSQLRGNGWGKRESPNWNNMRGLWGKRSPGWNKLSSAWGK